jgi:hypothetical protein
MSAIDHWGYTDQEARHMKTEEAYADLERREVSARLVARTARTYTPPTHRLVIDRVEGNVTYWKNVPLNP